MGVDRVPEVADEALAQLPPSIHLVEKGDARRFLVRGKVAIGGLLGDTAVLHAMRTNEDRTNAAYEWAVQTAGLPAESRAVLQRALGDERHHRDWIVSALKEM